MRILKKRTEKGKKEGTERMLMQERLDTRPSSHLDVRGLRREKLKTLGFS